MDKVESQRLRNYGSRPIQWNPRQIKYPLACIWYHEKLLWNIHEWEKRKDEKDKFINYYILKIHKH